MCFIDFSLTFLRSLMIIVYTFILIWFVVHFATFLTTKVWHSCQMFVACLFLNKKTKCYTSPGSGVAAAAASSIGIEVHGWVVFVGWKINPIDSRNWIGGETHWHPRNTNSWNLKKVDPNNLTTQSPSPHRTFRKHWICFKVILPGSVVNFVFRPLELVL